MWSNNQSLQRVSCVVIKGKGSYALWKKEKKCGKPVKFWGEIGGGGIGDEVEGSLGVQ